MGLQEFLSGFRDLHEKARRGALDALDRREYDGARDELARALLQAQKQLLPPGERPQSALKVAKALQVELGLPGERVTATTFELSASGFTTHLANPVADGARVKCSIRMPGAEPVVCEGVVRGSKRLAHSTRVVFSLAAVDSTDAERLSLLVFDEVIARLSARR